MPKGDWTMSTISIVGVACVELGGRSALAEPNHHLFRTVVSSNGEPVFDALLVLNRDAERLQCITPYANAVAPSAGVFRCRAVSLATDCVSAEQYHEAGRWPEQSCLE